MSELTPVARAIYGSDPNGGLVMPLIAEGSYREHVIGDWVDEQEWFELGLRVARCRRSPDSAFRYGWNLPRHLHYPAQPEQMELAT